MISIVVPTMRVGGLDVLFSGLCHQSDKNFEVIISDGLFKYRHDLIVEKTKDFDFEVKHVEPRNNPFPVASFCRYSNEALVHVSNDHVLFITDYTWLPSDTVSTHLNFHKPYDLNRGLLCPHAYYSLPQLEDNFPQYAWDEIDRYADNVRTNKLTDYMWSIFAAPFDNNSLEKNPAYHQETDGLKGGGEDPKIYMPSGHIAPEFFHAKNASVPTEKVIILNGWDEDLDGGHGYQDTEMSKRMFSNGFAWNLQKFPIARIVNPRPVFPRPSRVRSIQENEAIWKHKESLSYPIPNSWSIREARNQLNNA